MVTAFSVYLSGFYTHLNVITIENFPLNMVIKKQTHLYCLFRKWITRHVTFQLTATWYYFEAYRLLSPSPRLLHLSQCNGQLLSRTFPWTSCFNDIHTLPSPKVDKLVMWQLGIIWNLTVSLVWDESYKTTGKNITINHQFLADKSE